MVSASYYIDPDADTVIVLTNACTVFAPWDPICADTPADLPGDDHGLDSSVPMMGTKLEEASLEDGSPSGPPTALPEPEDNEIRYYVSSRHLMLASPVFRSALKEEGFAESTRNEGDGLFHIPAKDWDESAFLIVLQIIHLRNKAVPRTVDLEMLAKIAVVVDFYDCEEALELFSKLRLIDLDRRTRIPAEYCRDLVLWIWVGWVFNSKAIFRSATLVAIQKSPEALRTLGLPIPAHISDEIDSMRSQAIESMIQGLHLMLGRYRSANYVCVEDGTQTSLCGSLLLGTLTREMDSLAILTPCPENPFSALSVDSVCEKIEGIQSPEWVSYSEGVSHRRRNYMQKHPCSLTPAIESLKSDVTATVVGLDIFHLKKIHLDAAGRLVP
ncbi:hypothetical protein T440DRAFT_558419 [Plenodomus tracheiphilus IPT5]|uniref:BTB domain-containing protein n=1 Tax=Plenodomus tracheiphilus IPT5 TaxID=1408161 RepID=A0A6A7ASP5_9PLEO|nr:hypothetical protein T440DRAFT_558419 [Plenodomus tracheiphilus IPT5]